MCTTNLYKLFYILLCSYNHHVACFTVVNGYVELSHRSKDSATPTIRATDHHVNDNEPHSIVIRGSAAEWSLELDRKTTEYGKERDVDIQEFLDSTNLIYIGNLKIVPYNKKRLLFFLKYENLPKLFAFYYYIPCTPILCNLIDTCMYPQKKYRKILC